MVNTVSQPVIEVATLADRDNLSVQYPELQEGSTCRVTGDSFKEYRWRNQVWVQSRPDPMVLNALQATDTSLQGQIDSLLNALSGKADSSSLGTLATAIGTQLNGKADQTDVNKKPYVFLGGTGLNAPKLVLADAVVSGGNAVFYLTDTGLAGGNALFTTSNVRVQPVLFAVGAPPAFAPLTLSADRKTLTIPTTKAATGVSVLGINLLGANVPANGDTVSILVVGT